MPPGGPYNQRYAYAAETEGVTVRVQPGFLDDESQPAAHRYVWTYRIRIENESDTTWKLVSRYWRITDCAGRIQEVRGAGVVGQQPVLEPGASFEYASGAPLTEPSGVMEGIFYLEDEHGGTLEARVPLFPLDSPYDRRTPS